MTAVTDRIRPSILRRLRRLCGRVPSFRVCWIDIQCKLYVSSHHETIYDAGVDNISVGVGQFIHLRLFNFGSAGCAMLDFSGGVTISMSYRDTPHCTRASYHIRRAIG